MSKVSKIFPTHTIGSSQEHLSIANAPISTPISGSFTLVSPPIGTNRQQVLSQVNFEQEHINLNGEICEVSEQMEKAKLISDV